MKRRTGLALALLLLYWAISLHALTILPLVYEDEPWQASTGWKLATQGVFGSDLFAGYHNMEQRYYGYLPLHSFALAAVFRVAGLGLFQARYLSVVCGLLILALTFRLAQRLYHDARIGLVAIAILLFVRGFMISALHLTGILFLDVVRVARYDVLPPVFGLLALHAYLTASQKHSLRWYFLAGLAAAFAGLAHLYGAVFFIILLALALWERGDEYIAAQSWRVLLVLGVGFALPWVFYLGYVLQDVEAWRAQTRGYGERFELLNPTWYLENVRTEIHRYNVGFLQRGDLFPRPGFWFLVTGLSLTIGALAWRAFLNADRAARIVFVPLFFFPLLFALLVRVKFTNYLFVVTPFAALALAWSAIWLWDWLGRNPRLTWTRAAVGIVAVLVVLEGAIQIRGREIQAQTTTPYDEFIARVQEPIPLHTRVLGLQNYGLGWEEYKFRSLAIPFLLINPQLEAHPLTLVEALDAQQPDYLLMDPRMKNFLANGDAQTRTQFADWMNARGAVEVARVQDASYGVIEIYRLGP